MIAILLTCIYSLHGMELSPDERKAIDALGMKIRELREENGLSSAEVSRRLYMERGNYSRIETGKTNPTYLTVFRISKILGCKVSDLFD